MKEGIRHKMGDKSGGEKEQRKNKNEIKTDVFI